MGNSDSLKQCSSALSDWVELSTQIAFRSHFRFFKKQGISHSQISTLHMLYHRKQLSVGDISNMLSISKPAASQLLDNLVKRGFVERHEDEEDRRVKYHRLTEAGINIMKTGHSSKKDWYQYLMDDLSEPELETVKDALVILNSKIRLYQAANGGCHKGEKYRC